MARMKKVQQKLTEAIIEARDDALIEIGREATERKEARVGKARRRVVGKVAVAALSAGAALTVGAVALRRRIRKAEPPLPLDGQPAPPETPG